MLTSIWRIGNGMIKRCFLLMFFIIGVLSVSCVQSDTDGKKSTTEQVYLMVAGVDESDTLSLRESASSGSRLLFKISHDASGLIKNDESGKWVNVTYRSHTGWVHGRYVKQVSMPGFLAAVSGELSCIGTEPHWKLVSNKNKITYKKYDDESILFLSGAVVRSVNEADAYYATAMDSVGGDAQLVLKNNNQCSDGMSDHKYNYSIQLIKSQQELLSGCCKVLES